MSVIGDAQLQNLYPYCKSATNAVAALEFVNKVAPDLIEELLALRKQMRQIHAIAARYYAEPEKESLSQ